MVVSLGKLPLRSMLTDIDPLDIPHVPESCLVEAAETLTTVRDLVRWGASAFAGSGLVFGHGSDNALDESFHLVCWALHLPFDLPAIYLEATVLPSEREKVVRLLRQRLESRQPAAYLMGQAWFAGLAFDVDQRVLIPRSPIAELISMRFSPWLQKPPGKILDLCTGCGCIGIASALAFPAAQVTLVEYDAAAAAVCEKNVAHYALQTRVNLQIGDLFEPLGHSRYTLIVANPPYVPEDEWAQLSKEYHHEPRVALVGGSDGMDVVARIIQQAADHLTTDGFLVCEIGGSRHQFDERFPDFPAIWPDFDSGGDGVFLVNRADLIQWRRTRESTVSISGD